MNPFVLLRCREREQVYAVLVTSHITAIGELSSLLHQSRAPSYEVD